MVIFQKFYLEFTAAKSKKSLVFVDLLCSFPSDFAPSRSEEFIPDDSLFLISTLDPWYGDIIVYLHNSTFQSELTKDVHRCIHHQSQPYHIVGDTLYHIEVDSILHRCLTLEDAEKALNDCHSGACGGHMSGYVTT